MDQEDRIIAELKRRAKEQIKYGTFKVELKVQDGKIVAGEIIEERIKLG